MKKWVWGIHSSHDQFVRPCPYNTESLVLRIIYAQFTYSYVLFIDIFYAIKKSVFLIPCNIIINLRDDEHSGARHPNTSCCIIIKMKKDLTLVKRSR